MVRLFGFGVWQNILLTKKKQKVENIGKKSIKDSCLGKTNPPSPSSHDYLKFII